MEGSEFLSAFNEGRAARRDGHRKSFNPYLDKPDHQHLLKTWEGGWEFQAHSENCTVSTEVEYKRLESAETLFLACIYRSVQHFIGLDEQTFLKQFQSLSMISVPGHSVRITVFLPNSEEAQRPQ